MLTIQDMKRICKFSMKSYAKQKTSMHPGIEIEALNEYIRVYFTNKVSAAKLEIPKSSINVACSCSFMPAQLLDHLEASDKLIVSYLRDIEPIDMKYADRKQWHPQFESLMKTNPRSNNAVLKIEYDARLICDASNLIKQLGFKQINMSFVPDRVGFMSAFEGRSSIEFVIMPIVR